VWTGQVIEEPADAAPPNDAMEAVVDLCVHGDREFLRHFGPPIRITIRAESSSCNTPGKSKA
jgi:hypothetical protein